MNTQFVCNTEAFGNVKRQNMLENLHVNISGDNIATRYALFNLIGLGIGNINWFLGTTSNEKPPAETILNHIRQLSPSANIKLYDSILIDSLAYDDGVTIETSLNIKDLQKSIHFCLSTSSTFISARHDATIYRDFSTNKRRRKKIDFNISPYDYSCQADISYKFSQAINGILAANLCRKKAFLLEEQNEQPLLNGQIILPIKKRKKENNKTNALVIGAGGIGTFAMLTLAYLGYKTIDVIDFDDVERKNLNRQVLYAGAEGTQKAQTASNLLEKWFKLNSNGYNIKLGHDNFDILKETIPKGNYNSMLCCVDNFKARRVISALAYKTNSHLIEGGCDSFMGVTSQYVPSHSHTIKCQRRLKGKKDPKVSQSCTEQVNPSVIIPNAAIGTIMAYRSIAPTSTRNQLIFFDSINNKTFYTSTAKTTPCYCRT
jgi:molybdopterin/thiamine biosynthesis adenylyltransferase